MQLAELTVRGFADLLGSDAPAPGGGSAAVTVTFGPPPREGLPLYLTPVYQILKCYLIYHTSNGIIQLFPQDKCHTAFLPWTVLCSFIQTVHRT